MKIHKMKLTLALTALLSLIIVACNPEDGDTGPVGPVGSPGATGAKGDTGPAGDDGNANVQAYTFVVDTSMWTSGGGGNNASINVAQITSDVVNNGTIQVFHRFTVGSGNWNVMPFGTYFTSGPNIIPYHITFGYDVGTVDLRVYSDIGAVITFNTSMEFKVVVIPPASLVKGLDYTDHEMLSTVYGI